MLLLFAEKAFTSFLFMPPDKRGRASLLEKRLFDNNLNFWVYFIIYLVKGNKRTETREEEKGTPIL